MKLRHWAGAAVSALTLAIFVGCDDQTKTDVPGTAGSEITGQAPKTTGTPAEEEAGGAGAGGAFTATPGGETKPSEVPKDYPRPEGVTPPGEGAAKPAEAGATVPAEGAAPKPEGTEK